MAGRKLNSAPKIKLTWMALLRMLVGVMFLSTWGLNAFRGFYTPDGLLDMFTNLYPQVDNPFQLYARFITDVILPIRSVFAPFQLVAEGLLGLCLLVGAFTPFFSLVGIFFLLNTFLATLGHDWPWSYFMPIGVLAVTFFTQAGRAWGVDAYLLKRFGERSRWLW